MIKNMGWKVMTALGLTVCLVLPVTLLAVEQMPPLIEDDEVEIEIELEAKDLPPELPFLEESDEDTFIKKFRDKDKEYIIKKRIKSSGMVLKKLDLNEDSVVDAHEIGVALKKLGVDVGEAEELSDRLMEYDENGDEVLDYQELKQMRKDRPSLLKEFLGRREQFRDKFDLNKDGAIGDDEWDQVREARKRWSSRRQEQLQSRQPRHQDPHQRRLRGPQQPQMSPDRQGFQQEGPRQPHMGKGGQHEQFQRKGFDRSARRGELAQKGHGKAGGGSSPATVAAEIHQNIVRVFQMTAKRLEKAGDHNRALIVYAKLAEVEVHMAKALIRIQEKEFDEAVDELNNIVEVARSLPDIGPLPEVKKEQVEEQQEE